MTEAELAFKTGTLFNRKITDVFWDSFKGEYGRVQAEVLVYLYDHNEAPASEIWRALNISKQHVSKIIKEFTEEGFIELVSDTNDKRSSLLSLSDKGKQYVLAHFEISNAHFERLLSQMNNTEKKQFLTSMEHISNLLEKVQ